MKISQIIKEVVMEEMAGLTEVLWDIPPGKNHDLESVVEFFQMNKGVDPKRLINLAAHKYAVPLELVKWAWKEYLLRKKNQ